MPVTETEAKLALQSVLASSAFNRSPRMARLLAYLCNKYFDQQTDSIKEYTIAVEVLGRPTEFNPAEDAIARVEVHRLRRRLREYYESGESKDRIRIVIPPGHYAPVFLPVEEETEAAIGSPGGVEEVAVLEKAEAAERETLAIPQRPPSTKAYWVAAVLASVALALLLRLWLPRESSAVSEPSKQSGKALGRVPNIPAAVTNEVRILCGQRKGHTDRLGHQWSEDKYFQGGAYLERPRRFMSRTMDPGLFQNARTGDFSYDIPVMPGVYELRLYFAETVYGPDTSTGGGENSRYFDIVVNKKKLASEFDIESDAGGAWVADVRTFKDISPEPDGFVHLSIASLRAQAIVSAIELVPSTRHRQNPIRIYTQENAYTDSNGTVWAPDNYWSGGQTATHKAPVSGTRDPDLFARERYGNFSYAIPVGDGQYAVTIYMSEGYWGSEFLERGGIGQRLFDIQCNGAILARQVDIFKEAGGANRMLTKTFHGLKPNAQGKLLLSFVPVKNYASIYALEVIDETP